MSRRYAQFYGVRDLSEPAIVEEIEKAGWEVHRKIPVDLLCVKLVTYEQLIYLTQRPGGVFAVWIPLECKTPQKNGRQRKRKDQEAQDKICAKWRIDRPVSKIQARIALGEAQ